MVAPEEKDSSLNYETSHQADSEGQAMQSSTHDSTHPGREGEESLGEDAHEVMADEEAETQEEDFSQLEPQALYDRLEALVKEDNPLRVNRKVQALKDYFEVHLEREYQRQLEEFLAAGNDEMDFQAKTDPLKAPFFRLYQQFKKRRDAQIEQLNQEREANLKAKREILDQMKYLTDHLEEEPNSIQRFRQLQDQWRQIGQVPKQEIGNLREAYRFYVKRFYDSQSIYREFKALDRKKNKDRKEQLIQQLEALAKASDDRLIQRETRRLEEEWHRVGPVPEAEHEQVEERFKAAMQEAEAQRAKIEAAIREQEAQNLQDKWAIVEQIQAFSEFESDRPKDWVAKNEELSELINRWKAIGYVPREEKAKVTKAFNEAVRAFNHRKNQFFKHKKQERARNLQRKREIVEEMEQLLAPEDFKSAKEQVFALQREWKGLGRIPGNESDRLWKRFRELCDQFFDNLGKHYEQQREQEKANLEAKQNLCASIEQKARENVEDPEAEVKAFQEQWESIGYVPIKEKDRIRKRFHKAIEALLRQSEAHGQSQNTELQRYKLRLKEWEAKGDQQAMRAEERKLQKQLNQLSEEITRLEENIQLFGHTSGAQQLAQQYQEKLDQMRQSYEQTKEKLALLKSF